MPLCGGALGSLYGFVILREQVALGRLMVEKSSSAPSCSTFGLPPGGTGGHHTELVGSRNTKQNGDSVKFNVLLDMNEQVIIGLLFVGALLLLDSGGGAEQPELLLLGLLAGYGLRSSKPNGMP